MSDPQPPPLSASERSFESQQIIASRALPFAIAMPTKLLDAEFAPQAVSLFNNMKTPASIIAGAMVPLGLMSPVPLEGEEETEHRFETLMRRTYTPVAVAALLSEFISVVFATVAVNQLTETMVEPATSVW